MEVNLKTAGNINLVVEQGECDIIISHVPIPLPIMASEPTYLQLNANAKLVIVEGECITGIFHAPEPAPTPTPEVEPSPEAPV